MRKFKVIYRRLKKVWGYADLEQKVVVIDDRARGKKHLELVNHEVLHLLWPDEPEEVIQKNAILLTNTLWHEKYRRIDDTSIQPLQDGTL